MIPVVAHARDWIGTPYRHRAALRGVGCDCLGLILGVWRDLGLPDAPEVPLYGPDWAETGGGERLWQAAQRHLRSKPLTEPAPGDVLLFRMRATGIAKHLGIAADAGSHATFVHAYAGHGVVESALSLPWQRRLVARFAFREGKD